MSKINVYFPDDLEERYRAAGKPRGWLSQVCQQAVEQALEVEADD